MRSSVSDLPLDLAPSPQAVGTYLATTGWDLQVADDTKQVWLLKEGGRPRANLFLPLDSTYTDFRRRFEEALQRLCMVYDWDIFQLAASIRNARTDCLYVRADQVILDDSIPIRQAEHLITGTVDMLEAAAWATIQPRPSYSGRRPEAVKHFLDEDVRMGHTQRGSFVITVLTRLEDDQVIGPAAEAQTETQSGESDVQVGDTRLHVAPDVVHIPPFQRRVMATLASALSVVQEISLHANSADLSAAVDHGMSANLCESLQEMTQYSGMRSLDLSFSWAVAEQETAPRIQRVIFDRDRIPGLKPLSEKLRTRDSVERVTVYGHVVRLARQEVPDQPDGAMATVRGVVGRGRPKLFRVHVFGEHHEMAVQSYRRGSPLIVTGDLEREGKTSWLRGTIAIERTVHP